MWAHRDPVLLCFLSLLEPLKTILRYEMYFTTGQGYALLSLELFQNPTDQLACGSQVMREFGVRKSEGLSARALESLAQEAGEPQVQSSEYDVRIDRAALSVTLGF